MNGRQYYVFTESGLQTIRKNFLKKDKKSIDFHKIPWYPIYIADAIINNEDYFQKKRAGLYGRRVCFFSMKTKKWLFTFLIITNIYILEITGDQTF